LYYNCIVIVLQQDSEINLFRRSSWY